MIESKMLSPDALRRILKDASQNMTTWQDIDRVKDHIAALEAERDAALADNAALLRGLRRVTWQCRDQDSKEHEAADALADQPHPGAALLERMKRLEAALAPIAAQVRAVFEAHHAPSHCALGLRLKVEDGERVMGALEGT